MSVTSFIALRYLKTHRENRFFSWITVLSVAGIAIGIATMIVVLSVINGFENELQRRFLAAHAHVMIFDFPDGMDRVQGLAAQLKQDFGREIRATSPFVYGETMGGTAGLMQPVSIRGIVPRQREKVQSLKDYVYPKGALDLLQLEVDKDAFQAKVQDKVPAIIVGKGLMSVLGIKNGDSLELVSPLRKKKLGEKDSFKVVGYYDSGLKNFDGKVVIMSLPAARGFFGLGERVTGLEVGLYDPARSREVGEAMAEQYPRLSVREWQSINKQLFAAMEMERAVIGLIVALVAFVASFNILITLFVSVSHKQRDISVLRALGASNRQIMWLFVQQGGMIGLIGSLIGAVLALGIGWLIKKYHFVDLPDLYQLATLPVSFDGRVYAGVALAGVVICLLAAFYPAMLAARVTPCEGFKTGIRVTR